MCKINIKNGEYVFSDEEKETILVLKTDKKGHSFFKLPENSKNRQFADLSAVDKGIADHGFYDINEKKEKSATGSSVSMPKLDEYLTDEEKATIEAIYNKAKERREADKERIQTLKKRDKIEKELEKWQKELEEYEKAIKDME